MRIGYYVDPCGAPRAVTDPGRHGQGYNSLVLHRRDSMWTKLRFGKHDGKSLPQVLFTDPDWFFWAYEKRDVFRDADIDQAARLYKRARSIRIPDKHGKDLVVEYVIHPSTNKFGGMNVVPASQPLHEGASATFRKPVFDFGVISGIAKYDKLGGKIFLSSLKYYIFGNKSHVMNAKRCEDFFDDDTNFIL